MSTFFIICSQHGEIIAAQEMGEFHSVEGMAEFYASLGHQAIEVSDEEYLVLKASTVEDRHYFDGEVFVALPERPTSRHTFSFEQKAWALEEDALSKAQREKKAGVEAMRQAKDTSPIFYEGALFDADSKAHVNVMAWMVNISNGFTVPPGFVWRDASNIAHPADEAFITGLGAAMVQRGSLLYQQAWEQKAYIDSLTSISEVDSYTISF